MSGSLKNASTWQYNNKQQIIALADEKLKAEYESVKLNAKAFTDMGVPWTDELFFCFFAFSEEYNKRFKNKHIINNYGK